MKSYVKNRAQPEGSIAEGYLAEECLTFCSRYLDGIETRFNRVGRVDDNPNHIEPGHGHIIFPKIGRSVGKVSTFMLSHLELAQAHRYVLFNSTIADPFIEELRIQTKRRLRSQTCSEAEINKAVNKDVVEWFSRRVSFLTKYTLLCPYLSLLINILFCTLFRS